MANAAGRPTKKQEQDRPHSTVLHAGAAVTKTHRLDSKTLKIGFKRPRSETKVSVGLWCPEVTR